MSTMMTPRDMEGKVALTSRTRKKKGAIVRVAGRLHQLYRMCPLQMRMRLMITLASMATEKSIEVDTEMRDKVLYRQYPMLPVQRKLLPGRDRWFSTSLRERRRRRRKGQRYGASMTLEAKKLVLTSTGRSEGRVRIKLVTAVAPL